MIGAIRRHVSCHVREVRNVNGLRSPPTRKPPCGRRSHALIWSSCNCRCTNADRPCRRRRCRMRSETARARARGGDQSVAAVRPGRVLLRKSTESVLARPQRVADRRFTAGTGCRRHSRARRTLQNRLHRHREAADRRQRRASTRGVSRGRPCACRRSSTGMRRRLSGSRAAQAWRAFARHACRDVSGPVAWGPQPGTIGASRIFCSLRIRAPRTPRTRYPSSCGGSIRSQHFFHR